MVDRRSIVAWLALLLCVGDLQAADPLNTANDLLRTGNYAEAQELFQSQPSSAASSLGLARTLAEQGKTDQAEGVLRAAIERYPDDAPLHAELALRRSEVADVRSARESGERALQLDADNCQARWVLADLLRQEGKSKQYEEALRWFLDHYNARDDLDSNSLGWIGLAAAEHARRHRLTDQFQFLVGEFYPQALQREPNFWRAHLQAGRLFAEKYNTADATKQYDAALAINPRASEVQIAIAELALREFDVEKASRALRAARGGVYRSAALHRAEVDLCFINFQFGSARSALRAARRIHPTDERTLGRLAALYASEDGTNDDGPETRLGQLIAEVRQRNPRPGEFFETLAATLDLLRKYPAAAKYYQLAIESAPHSTTARGELGLVLMRLGREVEAAKLLRESFEIDPFNVRVRNMLRVLDVLAGYATIETEHFVVRFDRAQDEILARYAAEYLEEDVYPDVCKAFGYEPQGKSLFEIFSRAKNTSGHGWFSARMVGLPYVSTVGACAGQIVAIASPGDLEEPYHWAHVLRHEFVHVVNLQQTDFNIPHWLTEALAVRMEGAARPEEWDALLARRLADNKLYDLSDINLAFVRPGSSENWSLAYCQAALYADYLELHYGGDALARFIDAYRKHPSTEAALDRCFGVTLPEFEKGYRGFLESTVAERGLRVASSEEQVIALRLARAALGKNDLATAAKALEAALDRENPDEAVVALLAAIRLKSGDRDEAETLYRLAQQHFPHRGRWSKALAALYLAQNRPAELAEALERVATADADNLLVRRKLAQLARDREDFGALRRWSREALYIDVRDAEMHALLAEAAARAGEWAIARDEYEYATRLEQDEPAWHLALAEAYVKNGQSRDAVATLEKLLARQGDHTAAKQLLERLQGE